ncbi:hypothetical protein HAX54_017277, partial [Datura stramonium]|nr:hypothetical protein [Datura stramonium]
MHNSSQRTADDLVQYHPSHGPCRLRSVRYKRCAYVESIVRVQATGHNNNIRRTYETHGEIERIAYLAIYGTKECTESYRH